MGKSPPSPWQAARTTSSHALVTCTIGPGFDFADFRLAAEIAGAQRKFDELAPDLTRFL